MPPVSFAAKDGGVCSKSGKVEWHRIYKLVCTRNKGKLRWTRSEVPPSRRAVDISNPISPNSVETCQLRDQRSFKTGGEWQSVAYPALPVKGFTNNGLMKILLVPVDFSDVPGMQQDLANQLKEARIAAEWFQWYSQGVLNYEINIVDHWVRAPKSSEFYFWQHPGKSGTQLQSDAKIAEDYLTMAADQQSIVGIQAVWAFHPREIKLIDEGFAWRGLPSVFTIGSDTYRGGWPIWQSFVHEILHSHGLNGHFPKSALAGLASYTNTSAPSLNSWHSLVLGWTKPESIYCIDSREISPTSLTLVPLEKEQSGLRSVMVKLSDHEVIVIESHRKDRWSSNWNSSMLGVTIMKVDTRLDTVWDSGSATGSYISGKYGQLIQVGESFTFDGVKVSIGSNGEYDKVMISSN